MNAFVICSLGKADELGVPSARLESPDKSCTASVYQVEENEGFQTSALDIVFLERSEANVNGRAVAYSEDALGDLEKPTIEWRGDQLIISISRDAVPLRHLGKWNGKTIVLVRRGERIGAPPIGAFTKALAQDSRIWSLEDLTAKIWETFEEREYPPTQEEIEEWVPLLRSDRILKASPLLDQRIKVREVALTCIAELLKAPAIYQDLQTRTILYAPNEGRARKIFIKQWPDDKETDVLGRVAYYLGKGEWRSLWQDSREATK